MFETIPSIYWMIIIVIPVGFFTFILYQLGMVIKDSRGVVQNSTKILEETNITLIKTNTILDDVQTIVSTTKGTVEEVNSAVIVPVRQISGILSTLTAFISRIKK